MLMVVIDWPERMAPRARAPQVRLRLLLFTGGETVSLTVETSNRLCAPLSACGGV
jgi:hypothetical protein